MAKTAAAKPRSKVSRGKAIATQPSPTDTSESLFVYTDAASRDDLYILPKRQSNTRSLSRPGTAGGGSTRERTMDLNPNWVPGRPRPDNPRALTQPIQTEASVFHDPRLDALNIGVAIGSPSHTPWMSNLNDTPTSEASFGVSTSASYSSSPYRPVGPSTADEAIRQRGKWKMFGGLFSKKGISHPNTPATPFYQAIPDPRDQLVLNAKSSRTPFQQSPGTHRDSSGLDLVAVSNTSRVQKSKSKPLIPRLYTSPSPSSPLPPLKDFKGRGAPVPRRAASDAPLLHVDIPDVAMERYSIMFGNVLKSRRSSLMVRRQAQLERLKVVDDFPTKDLAAGLELLLPPRRATLPSPAKSPSYSLFPVPPERRPSPEQRGSPLSSHVRVTRSSTAPCVSLSHTTSQFHVSNAIDEAKVLFTVNSPSPVTESPETPPGEETWYSDVSLLSDASPLDEIETDPRDQPRDIFIRLGDEPTMQVVKNKPSRSHITQVPRSNSSTHQKPASQVSPISTTLESKFYIPRTSPRPDRNSSLNKPLPSPLIAIENEARQIREARNASLSPLPTRDSPSYAPRKGSLPVHSTRKLEPHATRKASLAFQPSQSLQKRTESRERSAHHRPFANHSREKSFESGEQASEQRLVRQRQQVRNQSRDPPTQKGPEQQPEQRETVKSPKPPNPLQSSPASAAEISIARQISISRRQQLLVPIVPRTVRQQQATLVVPREVAKESKMAEGAENVNRKSQHGMLETA